jgi:hypothetical protein
MSLQVIKVDTNSRRDVDRFIELQFTLYQDCAQWVPPIIDDMKLQLNKKKYPFYEHSEADFFIAERDGRPVGRIGVLNNTRYNDYRKSHTAFFYFFDAENDVEACRALFQAAENWAKERKLDKMVGAKGFLQADGMGILVEGFEYRPAMGIPYNFEYYAQLIEAAGYTRQRDFFSTYLPGKTDLPPRMHEIADKMMVRRGFTIKRFASKKELRGWIPRIVETYNQTFTDNWEFAPVTPNEAKVIGDRLLQIADPKLIKLVMKGDKLVGFIFGFPNLSDAIVRCKGRILPFGWFWLLREFKRAKWIDMNGAGILAEYRGLGINAIMYVEMERTVREGDFEYADMVQMEEQVLTLNDAKTMGGKVFKVHRIYEKYI